MQEQKRQWNMKGIEELEAKMKQMSTATTPGTGEATSSQPGTKLKTSQPPSTSGPPSPAKESVTSRIQELEAKMKQTQAPNPSIPTARSVPQQLLPAQVINVTRFLFIDLILFLCCLGDGYEANAGMCKQSQIYCKAMY